MPKLKEAGARRVLPLNVSGAFHSSLLNDASKELRKVLNKYNHNNPRFKIIYNVSGHEENIELNDLLERQICNSVYFEDSLKYLNNQGVDTYIEIGPGQTLTSFVKKTLTDVNSFNVSNVSGLVNLIEGLKSGN